MATKILALDGLNDSKLCGLVEQLLCTISGVTSARIDFMSQKLSLTIEGRDSAKIINEVVETLKNTMPEVTIRLTDVGEETVTREPLRVSRYSRDEEEEEEEDTPEDVARVQEAAALPQIPFDISPQTTLCFISTFLAAVCFLLAMLLPGEGMLSYFFSLVAFIFCSLGAVFLCTDSRYGDYKFSCVVFIPVCAVTMFQGQRGAAMGALLLFIGGLLLVRLLNLILDAKVRKTIDIHPPTVRCVRDGVLELIDPALLFEGDIIVVQPGETIPLDGFISDGASEILPFLQEESISPAVGEPVHCGDYNLTGPLTIQLAGTQHTSVAAMTDTLLLDTHRLRATRDTLRAKSCSVLSSAVLTVIAIAASFFSVYNFPQRGWFPVMAALLLLACPSGLPAAALNAQRGGILGMLRRGVIPGSVKALRAFSHIKTIIFGFTGVLTEGEYTVKEIWTAEEVTREHVLEVAASLECQSEHPIAQAIVARYEERGGKQVSDAEISMFENLSGYGVRAMYQHRVTLVGSERLMREAGIDVPVNSTGRVCVYVATRGEYLGALLLEDPYIPQATEALRQFGASGSVKLGILTGRDFAVALTQGKSLGINEVYAEQTVNTRRSTLQSLAGKEVHYSEMLYAAPLEDVQQAGDFCTTAALGASGEAALRGDCAAAIPSGELSSLSSIIRLSKRVQRVLLLNLLLSVIVRTALFGYILFAGMTLPIAALCTVVLMLLVCVGPALLYIK